jgi:hypothetical protein
MLGGMLGSCALSVRDVQEGEEAQCSSNSHTASHDSSWVVS